MPAEDGRGATASYLRWPFAVHHLGVIGQAAAASWQGLKGRRATRLGRTIFTQDEDFLAEATSRQRHGEPFAGVIYAHQLRVSIGQCVQDLELIAKCLEPEDFIGRVQHLPLR